MHWYSQKHEGESIELILSAIDAANVSYCVLHERSTERNRDARTATTLTTTKPSWSKLKDTHPIWKRDRS